MKEGIVTLRRCTMKSRIGFGKYAACTIAEVLHTDPSWIRQLYYTVETIDFTDDVKEAALIRVTIDKPGISEEAWVENRAIITAELRAAMTDEERLKYWAHRKKVERSRRKTATMKDYFATRMSKGQMQAVNHGHAYLKETGR